MLETLIKGNRRVEFFIEQPAQSWALKQGFMLHVAELGCMQLGYERVLARVDRFSLSIIQPCVASGLGFR